MLMEGKCDGFKFLFVFFLFSFSESERYEKHLVLGLGEGGGCPNMVKNKLSNICDIYEHTVSAAFMLSLRSPVDFCTQTGKNWRKLH